jgi:hypothetical protein
MSHLSSQSPGSRLARINGFLTHVTLKNMVELGCFILIVTKGKHFLLHGTGGNCCVTCVKNPLIRASREPGVENICVNTPDIESYIKRGGGEFTFSVPCSGKDIHLYYEMKYIMNSIYNESISVKRKYFKQTYYRLYCT